MKHEDFLRILQSLDAFFPIGAFTLSNGLEDYVLCENVGSEEDLRTYLNGFFQIFPYNDLGLLSLAYRNTGDRAFLLELDGTASAMKTAKEIRTGSSKMCSRFLKAREAMGDTGESLLWYRDRIVQKKAFGFHPIALGIYGAELEFPQEELLLMYGYSVASAMVNNAVKLVPLSQMGGQRILYEQLEKIQKAVPKAMEIPLEMLGVSGSAYEIHCMNHEYLYSRQYMS